MTNNPAKYGGLEGFGLEIVERVPLESAPNPENIAYLRTKREQDGPPARGARRLMSSNFRGRQSSRHRPERRRHRACAIGVVCGRFNDHITDRLLDGAGDGLAVHGVAEADVTVVWVPGAFEIPLGGQGPRRDRAASTP